MRYFRRCCRRCRHEGLLNLWSDVQVGFLVALLVLVWVPWRVPMWYAGMVLAVVVGEWARQTVNMVRVRRARRRAIVETSDNDEEDD